MKIVCKINKIIVRLEEVLIAAAVLIMSFMLVFNVVGRAFGKGINATEEIGLYCIYIITFIGLSYAITKGKHINMLGLFDFMPHKIQKVDALIISAVTAATMGVLTYISYVYVVSLIMIGRVSINLQVPQYIVVLVISFGFLFACLQYILVFIRNLTSKEIYLGLEEPYVPDIRREEK